MNRAHSYAQIPATESQGPATVQPSPRHGSSSTHSGGYAALNAQPDDDDFEDAQEDSAMLTPSSSSSGGPSTASAPRRVVYPDDDEISIAPEASSSSSFSSSSFSPSSSRTPTQSSSRNSGARTTNVSFLARLTGRQRPGTEARRMIQSTMDGVFSNLSAKPRVERPLEEELPPSYKSAALDISPAYYESTLMASGYDEDELLIEGLPVGGMFGFMWNVIISMSFQFVGFFLTYLLHTSHATKNGSKTGLGMTFISMGFQMMTGNFRTQGDGSDEGDDMELDTGYVTAPVSGGPGGSSPASLSSLRSIAEYTWLSYFMLTLGALIVVQSVWEFAKAKKAELRMIAANGPSTGAEETVPASQAAGYELSSIISGAVSSSSSSGSGSGTRVIMTVTGPSV